MSHFKKYALIVIILVSLIFNGIFYVRLRDANEKIQETNQLISLQVEKGIRQSIGYMTELNDNQSQSSMQNLQRTLQDLSVAFKHWLDLNQTELRPNPPMERGLTGIEALRNAVIHHLNNQYLIHDNQLSEYDQLFLERANEGLGHLLKVYNNIKDHIPDLRDSDANDGGLIQVAANFEELTRLYRHSLTPNQHPGYITLEEAVKAAEKSYPILKSYGLLAENGAPQIRDGVHYYQLSYYRGKNLAYVIWIDAIDGSLRSYEVKNPIPANKQITQAEAVEIAQSYVANHYEGKLITEMFKMKVEEADNDTIYAFRLTPIINDIQIISDAYGVNVSSRGGEILKYTNDFDGTAIPSYERKYTEEAIKERYNSEYSNLEYNGISLVRSFQTYYRPRVAYRYTTVQNEQQMLVFFDTETGRPIYQLYYIYQPLEE